MICAIFDDEPIFGKITDITVMDNNLCLFVLDAYEVVTYNKHNNAYEVKAIGETVLCQKEDLANNHILMHY